MVLTGLGKKKYAIRFESIQCFKMENVLYIKKINFKRTKYYIKFL